MIGGEESGGLAVRGHIPERDGLLSSLLLLEAVATSGKSLTTLFAEIEEKTNFKHCYDRADLHLAPDFDKVAALTRAQQWTRRGRPEGGAGQPQRRGQAAPGGRRVRDAAGLRHRAGRAGVCEAHSEASLRRLLSEATQRLTAQEA